MDPFQDAPTDPLAARDGRLRLLLVEHNETDARILLNLIRRGAGDTVEVVWVSSFVDALGHLRKDAFDAMLLDLFLHIFRQAIIRIMILVILFFHSCNRFQQCNF